MPEFVHVAALVTVLGVTIYIVGLIALCWPIYRRVTDDASTAVFAASMVPRTVVAAQGVRIFVGFPLIAALFLLTVVSMARWLPKFFELVSGKSLQEATTVHLVFVAGVAIVVTLCFVTAVKRLSDEHLFDFFYTPATKSDASPVRRISIALSALGGAAAGGFLFLTVDQMSWTTILLALAVFFGSIALSGVPDAISITPPLPGVNVKEKDKEGEVKREYQGMLLTHSENHWYVFDTESNILHMIPDESADVVSVQPRVGLHADV